MVSSKLWLWELNENWDVRPVAEFISEFREDAIYIGNSFERPSLNWYSQKQIKSFNEKNKDKCVAIMKTDEWNLYTCKD